MADIKGITIKIEGDTSGLAKDLNSVNKDIRQTSNALKDVEKALKLDPTNVELLSQKQELLNKQIQQTEQKLAIEREAAEKAKEALDIGAISQEEYASLQAELVKTESSLNNLKSEAEFAATGIDKTGDAAQDAGDKVEESGSGFEKWGQAAKVAAEVAAAAIATVGTAAIAAGKALVDMTVDTAHQADELMTLSTVTGLSTDRLQEMEYASELLDVSTDTITGSMTKMIKAMGSGSSAFDELGVSIYDANGNLRDSEEVYWEAIEALGQIDNEAERDVAAMELFGKSAMSLNPLIEAGADGFNALAEEAHDAGYVMSGDTLEAFGEFDDNLRRLDNGTKAAKNALGGILLPVLNNLAGDGVDLLGDFTNALIDADGDISQMSSVIETVLPEVLGLFDEYIPQFLELAGSIIEVLCQGIIDLLPDIIETATEIVVSIAGSIVDSLPTLIPSVVSAIMTIVSALIDNLPQIISAAVQIVVSIAKGISDNLSTLIPSVVSAILEIADTLTSPENLTQIIMAALEIMIQLGIGLVNAIPEIVSRIPEIIANIIGAFAELGPQLASSAREWGADLISNLVSGITNALGSLREGVSNVASTISSYLHFSVPDVGPLADFDESGGDMIDVFVKGMTSKKNTLARALDQTGAVINNSFTSGIDYSGVLNGISGQLTGLGAPGVGGTTIINVMVGKTKLATAVIDAQQMNNYRSGGTV